MKRFTAIIFSLFICISFTACSSKPTNSPTKETKPWDWGSSSIYEYSEYAVSRYYIKNDKENEIGSGKMSFTLDTVTLIDSASVAKTFLRLKMKLKVDYIDDPIAGIDRGLSDEINSEVIFSQDGLTPIWMHKKADISDRTDTINGNNIIYSTSYELEACYDENYYGENFRERYDGKKAYFAEPSFAEGQVKSISLKNGNNYDNEEMLFVIRAMNDLKAGSSLTMYTTNIYNIFDKNKYFEYLINVVCASSNSALKMNDKITSLFSEDKLTDSEDGKKVDCIFASAYISDADSGTPIRLYYAANPFASPATSNVLMKMETSEYNLSTRSIEYKTTYELIDYSAT